MESKLTDTNDKFTEKPLIKNLIDYGKALWIEILSATHISMKRVFFATSGLAGL